MYKLLFGVLLFLTFYHAGNCAPFFMPSIFLQKEIPTVVRYSNYWTNPFYFKNVTSEPDEKVTNKTDENNFTTTITDTSTTTRTTNTTTTTRTTNTTTTTTTASTTLASDVHRNVSSGFYEDTSPPVFKKIYGGSFAKPGQFPWIALIHNLHAHFEYSLCGGSIISSRWILTAAHCISSVDHSYLVVLGDVDQNNIVMNQYHGPGIAFIATNTYVHPQYSSYKNDIALINLPQDVQFTRTIQPITLAGRKYAAYEFDNEIGTVMGWGIGESQKTETFLKYGHLSIITYDKCYKYWQHRINRGNMCTGPSQSVVCVGDSGGPLIVNHQNSVLQVGIVSFGDKHCPSTHPRVFVRVAYYSDWIKKITGIDFY